MKAHHWSQGLFLIGMAALIASLIPACGGGGGAGAAPQAGVDHKIHLSSVTGPTTVPASQTDYAVRSITFTPSNPNDVVLYVTVEGTSSVSAGSGDLTLHLLDADGAEIDKTVRVGGPYLLPGAGVTYLHRLNLETSWGYSNLANGLGRMPSNSYTIQLKATTNVSWVGQLNSIQFKIFTAENVTVVSPSSNISG